MNEFGVLARGNGHAVAPEIKLQRAALVAHDRCSIRKTLTDEGRRYGHRRLITGASPNQQRQHQGRRFSHEFDVVRDERLINCRGTGGDLALLHRIDRLSARTGFAGSRQREHEKSRPTGFAGEPLRNGKMVKTKRSQE
jgi:hypothetical protein